MISFSLRGHYTITLSSGPVQTPFSAGSRDSRVALSSCHLCPRVSALHRLCSHLLVPGRDWGRSSLVSGQGDPLDYPQWAVSYNTLLCSQIIQVCNFLSGKWGLSRAQKGKKHLLETFFLKINWSQQRGQALTPLQLEHQIPLLLLSVQFGDRYVISPLLGGRYCPCCTQFLFSLNQESWFCVILSSQKIRALNLSRKSSEQ